MAAVVKFKSSSGLLHVSCLIVGHVLTHCITIESRKAFRRIQALLAEIRRHCPYAPGRSQDAQLWHEELPGPENRPVPQGEHVEAPARLYVPLGHMPQLTPCPYVKLPGGQGEQAVANGPEDSPGGHKWQVSDSPPSALNVLIGQGEHIEVDWPVKSTENQYMWPGGQANAGLGCPEGFTEGCLWTVPLLVGTEVCGGMVEG